MAERRKTGRRKTVKRGSKGIAAVAAVLILIAGGYVNYDELAGLTGFDYISDTEFKETAVSGEMKITFLVVGQGDCTVIQTDGHHMMIDAGNNNQGEKVVSFLEENGIEILDYLIFTHPDADHIGGGDNVLEAVEVEKVIMPDVTNDTVTYDEVMEDLDILETEVIYPEAGDRFKLGDAEFTVLCPALEFVEEEDINEASVGVRLVHGKNAVVMCGDAEEGSEREMVRRFGKGLECDVLKCGHHGSSTATSDIFLEAANPTWAVISCGIENPYGHPHREVLSRLEEEDIQIYRTDEMGSVTAFSDGTAVTWKCEK